ncbi:MAG: DUF4224 domain-containing protein [Burkholderiales bacterium]|nr:DUF4224 domain-containing protein [Burkholderiales bacterium]
MSQYLSASDLADLVGCKPNQKSMMIRWLDEKKWIYHLDRHGLPKVLIAYHDKKMGLDNRNHQHEKYAQGPNLNAFAVN